MQKLAHDAVLPLVRTFLPAGGGTLIEGFAILQLSISIPRCRSLSLEGPRLA